MSAAAISLTLDPNRPRADQVYRHLRELILTGGLAAGQRLPATRTVARSLGLSRNTVLAAYDRLAADGFIDNRRGAGAFVSADLPQTNAQRAAPRPAISHRARAVSASKTGHQWIDDPAQRMLPFAAGIPDLSQFPFAVWARLLARHWRRPDLAEAYSPDPAGLPALRHAIAGYLQSSRDLDCTPDQIIVVSGAQAAIDLVARLLLNPGDTAWIEDPGYPGTASALLAAGAKPVPVPVDGAGLDVAAGIRTAPTARLACVTPTHQFPLGMTMSLPRRLELLDWASGAGAFVLEDDYDGEYRYTGKPLQPLFNLDHGRVIYIGSLSRAMFPGLRVGYLVVPAPLVGPALALRRHIDGHPAVTVQPALADFIAEGHFAAHLRRTRTIYAARQDHLLDLAGTLWQPHLQLTRRDGGVHVIGRLNAPATDRQIAGTAAQTGVVLRPLSTLHHASRHRHDGLILGYAGHPEAALTDAANTLAEVLRQPL